MAETGRSEIVWRPTKEYAERTRIARFMRAQKIDSLEELQRRSVEDPEWYWDAVVRDLGVRFTRPFTRVLDTVRGVQWPRWFPDGLLNFTDNCVDRNIDGGRGDQPAIIWEGDDGQSRTLTYRELASEVNRRSLRSRNRPSSPTQISSALPLFFATNLFAPSRSSTAGPTLSSMSDNVSAIGSRMMALT